MNKGTIIIDSILSEPPSEIYCFRDLTLYSKVYCFEDVLIQCPVGTRTFYWNWLKRYGAHDFISQLITNNEKELGFSVGRGNRYNLSIDRLCSQNLNQVISFISRNFA
jgi:hypothetical protein